MDLATLKATLPTFDIDTNDILPQLEFMLQHNLKHIDVLLAQDQPYTWASLCEPMDEDDAVLSRFWATVEHLNAVMNNEPLRKVYEKCLPKLSEYSTRVSHNEKLYQAILSIRERDGFSQLDVAQQKAIDNHLRDFKLAGVSLSKEKKAKFAQTCQLLSELSNRFENHVLDATHAWTKQVTSESELQGLPDLAKAQLAQAAKQANKEGWLINLDMPNYFAIMSYAENRALRQAVYTAFVTRASDVGPNGGQWDNTPVMYDILSQRLVLARLLGFDSYAEHSLATKMVKESQQVLDFLNELAEASLPRAQQEFTALGQFARETLHIDDLQAWDVLYASEKLRLERYAVSPEILRPYFPVDRVMSGLFEIVNKLFGIRLERLTDVPVWHEDVYAYVVLSAKNEPMAVIYFDLYARANKRGGAWMTDFQVRRRSGDGIALPIAFVTCNFAGPVGDQSALLQHDDVVTLFHEFGHALQHMLTEIDVADVSGINGVPWDAVEVASQFLENWAWQRESLDMISSHIETGDRLPDDLFEKMIQAKNFQSAMAMMRQLEFALFDYELHLVFNPDEEAQVQAVLDRVRERVAVVPVPAFNRFQHGFSHIFAGGYAAGYYSYKWAEVMAADAFELFLENGVFDADTSLRFRDTFLARGGVEEPADLFEQFRGRAPAVTALLKQSGILV